MPLRAFVLVRGGAPQHVSLYLPASTASFGPSLVEASRSCISRLLGDLPPPLITASATDAATATPTAATAARPPTASGGTQRGSSHGGAEEHAGRQRDGAGAGARRGGGGVGAVPPAVAARRGAMPVAAEPGAMSLPEELWDGGEENRECR